MLTIGDFARRVGLTVKTVRLYQRKELLPPARIDSWTGYRYYDDSSIERAGAIVELRRLEFSLGEIRDILAHYQDHASVLEFLRRQREVIEDKLTRYNHIIRSLDQRIRAGKEILVAEGRFEIDRDVDRRVAGWLARTGNGGWSTEDNGLGFTVSSAWGAAGGEALAVVLGKRVGFDVWDRELIAALAADPGRRDAVLGALDDDDRAAVDQLVAAATGSGRRPDAAAEVVRLAAALAIRGRVVLLEVGGNFLLPGERAVHVRLVPDTARAIEHHARRQEISAAEAERDLQARGATIAGFVDDAYGRDLTDPSGYDLVLNSATLHLFCAVDLCIQAYESKLSPEPGWWHG